VIRKLFTARPGVEPSESEMVMKTKVVNTTGEDFLLKEGTAGIYRLLKKLKPGEFYTISVDPNATYREYWCAVKDDDPKAVILSSDDCQEYSVVRIKGSGGGASGEPPYSWGGDFRDPTRRVQEALEGALPCLNSSEESSNEPFIVKFGKKLIPGFFKRGNPET
jgi:hypothetical protein